jgi:peptide/nickel transport system ATP-binding protein
VEQDAASTLHPLITVGTQLRDCIAGSGGKKKREEVFRLLREVELDPDLLFSRYPHRLSGGQAQRITVARALAVGAEMLVADEPTANVDLLSQRKLLEVLTGTVVKYDLPCLLVTHDLSIAEEVASSIAVISQGRIVEYGDPEDILYRPKSSYTRRLINSTLREKV